MNESFNQDKIHEMIQLYLMGELSQIEKENFEKLLRANQAIRTELENYKRIFGFVSIGKPGRLPGDVITESRSQLVRNIRAESLKPGLHERVDDWFESLHLKIYKIVIGSAVLIAAGILTGYIIFAPGSAAQYSHPIEVVDLDNFNGAKLEIEKIRPVNTIEENGNIKILFEVAQPYIYEGNIKDKTIQRLLASALIKTGNAGLKIQTVRALSSQIDRNLELDPQIKKALITSLKTDENAGVRKAALNILAQFSLDSEIRDVLLFVLSNDKNSGLRVDAINALANFKSEGFSIDDKIKQELSKRADADDSQFIKMRAAALLKGDE